MATSPAVRLVVCCADALVARVSKPVPMVTAPAAANPLFRKLRRFRGLLIALPSFVILFPFHKVCRCRALNFEHSPLLGSDCSNCSHGAIGQR